MMKWKAFFVISKGLSIKQTAQIFSEGESPTLNAIFNESVLIHFKLGKFYSNENLMPVWKFDQNDRHETHTSLSFISPQFMRTQLKSWLNTEVKFSTKTKSHTGLSSFAPHVDVLYDMAMPLWRSFVRDEKALEEKFCYFDTCNYLKEIRNSISEIHDLILGNG